MDDTPREPWPLADGQVDLVAGLVVRGGDPQSLTGREVALLRYLADHAERPVPREELLREVWKYKARYRTRAVEQTVTRLRKKLEPDPAAPSHLVTVHGRGYRLLGAPRAEPAGAAVAAAPGEVVCLVGPAGVGKTTRARAWAVDHGAAWVGLGGVVSPVALRRRAAEVFHQGDDDPDALVRALGEAGHVVFDEAEGLDAEAEALLGDWLRRSRVAARVTSQRPLALPGRRDVVRGLDPAGAVALLSSLRSAQGLPSLADDVLLEAAEAVGGHPLALKVVAPWLGVVDPGDEALLHLPVDATTLDAALRRSIERLSGSGAELLAVASHAHDGHRLEALATLTGSLPDVLVGARALRDAGLADLDGDRLHVLPLVRRIVSRSASPERWLRGLAVLRRSPDVLRPWRHDLEAALTVAVDERLLSILLRHVQVLYTYGPRDGVRSDVERALRRLRPELAPRGQVVWALAMLSASHTEGVGHSLETALEGLDDVAWRARAWSLMALAYSADGAMDDACRCAEEALKLVGAVEEPALSLDLVMRGSLPLRRIGDPRGRTLLVEAQRRAEDGFPERALAAAMSLAFDRPAEPAVVARLEVHLERAQPAMGTVSWHLQLAYVGLQWLELGQLERGRDALYEAVAHLPRERSEAVRVRAALTLLWRPQEARDLVEDVALRGRSGAALVRAVTAAPPDLEGLPDGLAALARAWLDEEELPTDPAYVPIRRSLVAARRARVAVTSR